MVDKHAVLQNSECEFPKKLAFRVLTIKMSAMLRAVLVPSYLKWSETERGTLFAPPPVPYVPPKPDLVDDGEEHSVKLKISEGVEEKVSVFRGGIPEGYLSFVQTCTNIIRKKELQIRYLGFERERSSADEALLELQKAMSLDEPKSADSSEAHAESETAKRSKHREHKKEQRLARHNWQARELVLIEK